jgi:predicted dehydrogenase
MAEALRSAGVVFVPCHQHHFSPNWQAVRRVLPRIGRVYLAEHEVQRTEANPGNPNCAPTWRTDRNLAGGGILFDHGATPRKGM